MASTAPAYPNSSAAGSAKERHAFTVAELETLFESSDLSRRFYTFLSGMWKAAGKPFGREILLFKATEDYQKACRYRSERTVRYNLRAAEKLGLLEIVGRHHEWIRPRNKSDRGLYRSVTTYRLSPEHLLYWRAIHRGEAHHADVMPIRKPALPAPPDPLPPAPAVPSPARKTAADQGAAPHRSNRRGAGSMEHERQRTLRASIVRDMTVQMQQGKNQEEALRAVCARYGVTADEVQEVLKLCLFKAPDKSRGEAGGESCYTCGGEREIWNQGKGPRRIPCPACSKSP